jgi:hypothetical protein
MKAKMMYCWKQSSSNTRQQCKYISCKAYSFVGFLQFIWKQASWRTINETWEIAWDSLSMRLARWKTSLYLSLINDSTPSVTRWLEMVKIARKSFEVLSKGEGQATTWWPRNLARVKKEVLTFSQSLIKTYWSYWSGGSKPRWLYKEVTLFGINSHC